MLRKEDIVRNTTTQNPAISSSTDVSGVALELSLNKMASRKINRYANVTLKVS